MSVASRARHRARLLEAAPEVSDVTRATPLVRIGRYAEQCLALSGFADLPGVDDGRSRFRGVTVILGMVLVWFAPLVAIGFVCLAWKFPVVSAGRRRKVQERAMAVDVLLAVELCAVAFHTGATVPLALELVAPHVPGPLGTALTRVVSAYLRGGLLDDELSEVGEQFGGSAARFTAILRAAHRDGDPVVAALDRLADQLRAERRRVIEIESRRLSVRLLVPLVCCSLPGFVLIGVVPLMAVALSGLSS